jgi:hypothetical protein
MRLIRECAPVIEALKRGQTMSRGCNGGWYIRDREGLATARVLEPAAIDAIESRKIKRLDDMATVCGEKWGVPQ